MSQKETAQTFVICDRQVSFQQSNALASFDSSLHGMWLRMAESLVRHVPWKWGRPHLVILSGPELPSTGQQE